jgi:dolichyl-diphosphooligosaccharide---protein glycosyltransferase subunit 1 (ribophorin I)
VRVNCSPLSRQKYNTRSDSVSRVGADIRFLRIYKVTLPQLANDQKISLVVSTAYVDVLTPYPGIVAQDARQSLVYTGEKYVPSLYTTLKQKTKIKSPPSTPTLLT